MKPNDFDEMLFKAAQPLPVQQAERSGAIASLMARMLEAWAGLYAAPPRRLGPMI